MRIAVALGPFWNQYARPRVTEGSRKDRSGIVESNDERQLLKYTLVKYSDAFQLFSSLLAIVHCLLRVDDWLLDQSHRSQYTPISYDGDC